VGAQGTLGNVPGWARALLDEGRVAHLGLLDDTGRPRVMPVTFAVVGDRVWSAVDDKPKRRPGDELARVRWLRARPESAITVDRYDDDWSRLAWVQLIGSTAVVEAREHDEIVAALTARYPHYGDHPPPGPLLSFTPQRALWWRATENG
jgi:PPOX class probable F420-dependent enzyme